jgi:hypothetical protein
MSSACRRSSSCDPTSPATYENAVIGSVKFSAEKPLKLTYEHLLFQKIFRLAYARHKGEIGRGEDGRGGQGRGAEGGEGMGWEGVVPDCKNENLATLDGPGVF